MCLFILETKSMQIIKRHNVMSVFLPGGNPSLNKIFMSEPASNGLDQIDLASVKGSNINLMLNEENV